MDIDGILIDGFGRIREEVHAVLDGASPAVLVYRPDPDANSISWLLWHLTRVQDDHVADVAGVEQRWTADGWYERFGLPFPPSAHGYGHTGADVAAVQADGALLRDYFDAVHEATVRYLATLSAGDLDRIVDTRWDPPVSLGVRLVSVIADDLQHVGQAAYVRGVAERLGVS